MNVRDEKDNNVERRSTDGKKNKMEEDFPSKPAGYVSVDRISGLPDDVLAIILSQLSFKQATQTSLLSTRWKSLWALFTGTLDFDASDRLRAMDILRIRILDVERKRFVNWVNKVLDLHKARSIDGMRICFDVDCRLDLDSWMSFAVKKRVRTLELNLSRFSFSPQLRESYTPPLHLLNYLGLSCVTTLHLVHVNVTGESLQHILSENPFLERLSVEYSPSLVSLKISGPSLKLKHLELRRCFQLKDLQLSSPNLLSLKYSGPVISNPFVNVPCLTEVSLGGLYCDFIMENNFQLSSLLMQLLKLKLDIGLCTFEQFPQNIPEFKNLKHLELVVFSTIQSLLPFTSLLRAAPSLCGLKMKFPIAKDISKEMRVIKEKQPFRCLKTIEILGFVGGATDMEFVYYLLENAVELEKLIIDTCQPSFLGTSLESEHRGLQKCKAARQRAAELVARLPPRAELVVL